MQPSVRQVVLLGKWSPVKLFQAGQQGLWFDPSDGSTVPATGILDKSGNNNHATQATGTKQPTSASDAIGAYLLFDGSNDFLATASINFSGSTSIGIAAAFTPGSTSGGVVAEFSVVTTGNDGFCLLFNDPTTGKIETGVGVAAGGQSDFVATTSTSLGNGVTSLASVAGIDMAVASATARLPLRINGAAAAVSVGSDTAGAGTVFGNYPLYIGGRAGTSLFASMKLRGLVIRGTPFTAAELAKLETWMGAKAGLVI